MGAGTRSRTRTEPLPNAYGTSPERVQELAEQVAGYDLLDVPDLDAAIALAAAHPASRVGVIEIRPRWPIWER